MSDSEVVRYCLKVSDHKCIRELTATQLDNLVEALLVTNGFPLVVAVEAIKGGPDSYVFRKVLDTIVGPKEFA